MHVKEFGNAFATVSADVVIMHKIFRKEFALFDIKRRCSYNNSTQMNNLGVIEPPVRCD